MHTVGRYGVKQMAWTVDAHHHYWKAVGQKQSSARNLHSALDRDFGPEHLVTDIRNAGVNRTVIVQSADESSENDRLAGYASNESVAGVVAWLPLRFPSAVRSELLRLKLPKLCGVRCSVAGDALEWLDTAASIALFTELAERRLSWDVVPTTNDQMQAVLRLARAVPELNIVIDHLGRPPVETLGWEPWASNIQQLAACPNVAMKISVGVDLLLSWERWDPPFLERYLEWSFSNFGPHRLMLASNWPVVLLKAGYVEAWTDLASLAEKQVSTLTERDAIWGETAADWYRLRL